MELFIEKIISSYKLESICKVWRTIFENELH